MDAVLSGAGILLWTTVVLGSEAEVCGQRPLVQTLGSRIIGGHDALPGAWPWQVSLQYSPFGYDYQHLCGGSIIHKMWVMTAAHCFRKYRNHRDWIAVFGVNDILKPGSTKQTSKIKGLQIHRNFDVNTMDNDLAMLELENPVKYTDYVQPICLGIQLSEVDPSALCFITGWGTTAEVETSQMLQEAQIDRISASLCNSSGWYNGIITDNMICAGFEDGGIDTCQGDSGGPFVCYIAERESFYQLGLTSFGYECAEAHYPGVYTRLQNYVNWTRKVTNHIDGGIHGTRLDSVVKIYFINAIGMLVLTKFM